MLGVNVRTSQRWAPRYEAEGEAGVADRGLCRPSPRRAPQEELERMLGLYRDKYADFTVKHFHEQLVKRHGYKLGYTVTKLNLHVAGLVKPARSRSAHRKKRQRRPLPGMMLHQDGSRHIWIEGRPPMDLIVTLDDATSEVYSMILVAEEGTASTLRALREVIAAHGLFCALYTDRGGHYFHIPKGGEKGECQIFCVRGFRDGRNVMCSCISRSPPSNAWWPTKAGQQALSRPLAAEGGGRRPAFTGLADRPYSYHRV